MTKPVSTNHSSDRNCTNKPVPQEHNIKHEAATREDVHVRARELAFLDGRSPQDVVQADYEQAKRELTGESTLLRQEAALDAISANEHREPKPASILHPTP